MLFHSQMKNEKKPSFSPEVSPINGILQDTLRDSHLDQHEQGTWMVDQAYTFPNMSNEAPAQQMPLQMQQSTHMVYQSLPQPFPMRSPDRLQAVGGANRGARMLPTHHIKSYSNLKEKQSSTSQYPNL